MAPDGSEQLTDKKLKFGYWVATHRRQLRLAATGAVGAVTLVIVAIFGVNLVDWLTHIRQTQEILAGLSTPLPIYESVRRPENVVVIKAESVIRDEKSVDAYAHIRNPNDIWGAVHIEYEIFVGGNSVARSTTTLAPLQEKFLTAIAPSSASTAPAVTFQVLDIQWEKFPDPEEIPVDSWEVLDPTLTVLDVQEELVFRTELRFTLKNRSVYGFRDAQVTVLMTDDTNTVHAVGSVTLDEITSLQSRELVFRWPARLDRSLTPVVYVNVDKLSENRIIGAL
jgi:hypothetical protein